MVSKSRPHSGQANGPSAWPLLSSAIKASYSAGISEPEDLEDAAVALVLWLLFALALGAGLGLLEALGEGLEVTPDRAVDHALEAGHRVLALLLLLLAALERRRNLLVDHLADPLDRVDLLRGCHGQYLLSSGCFTSGRTARISSRSCLAMMSWSSRLAASRFGATSSQLSSRPASCSSQPGPSRSSTARSGVSSWLATFSRTARGSMAADSRLCCP